MGALLADSGLFTSGSLLSTDYLTEAVKGSPEYRAVDVVGLRAQLDRIAAAFPQSHRTNEAQTEDDFIWPALSALGWSEFLRQQNLSATGRDDVPDGLLFADAEAKAAANAKADQWRRYAHGLAVVESKRWNRPLDRASGREEATAPSTQMLRYLRRIDDLTHGQLRWGILTNGTRWRLYWAGARSVSEEFLEIDLGLALGLDGDLLDSAVSDEDRDHWLRVFAVLFSRDAFIKTGLDKRSFHERARAEAAFYEERVAANLSKLVFEQVFPSLATAISQASPEAPLQDVRDAALVLLYRLLFLLYAEDRDLLPVNDKRYDDYALRRVREDVEKRISGGDTFSASAAKIWAQISDLARIIDKGDASVGIPPYNGGLFAAGATPLLDSTRISDAVMAPTLDALSYDRTSGEPRYINYRDLSVQQLGSIYERLLEFELVRGEAGLITIRPNLFARKNTGSYYTPDELVGLILDETLEPLIADRMAAFDSTIASLDPKLAEERRGELDAADPAEAILRLRICDPAMGSGHFLVSLVDTLADHVLDAMAEATVRVSAIQYQSPIARKIEDIRATIIRNANEANWAIDRSQLDDRHIIRRMVLKRCIYGVDKNPMAVELAKVSLWLHTFTVGAPLSFIDHHLRCGDSLFGLWVRDAIDKAKARGGGELLYAKALRDAQAQASAMQIIERLVDVEIAEAHKSADTFFGIQSGTAPLNAFMSFLHALDWLDLKSKDDKVVLRAWLDGLFGNPIDIVEGRAAPNLGNGRRAEGERFAAILEQARALIAEERFLNWQVTFPGVWEQWDSAERRGGFDAVVGNPPWEEVTLDQIKWFAGRRPEIANENVAAKRAASVAKLIANDDPLVPDFQHAAERAVETARMVRAGGIYEQLSSGELNLYKLFVERAQMLLRSGGMLGFLVPIGIGTDQSSAKFFSRVVQDGRLRAFLAFENKRRWLFRDVHSEDQPTVLVIQEKHGSAERFKYAVKLHQIPDLKMMTDAMWMSRDTLKKSKSRYGDCSYFSNNERFGVDGFDL